MQIGLQRPRASVLQPHAFEEPFDLLLGRNAVDLGQVGAPHAKARVHQQVSEIAVVGDDQRAFHVVVEPPHRVDALGDLLEIRLDRLPPLGIAQGGDHPGRLVEQVVHLVLRLADGAAIHRDHVLVQIRLAPQLADDLAVDGDLALLDQLLALAPRGHAGVGEDLLQPLHAHGSFGGSGGGGGASFSRPP